MNDFLLPGWKGLKAVSPFLGISFHQLISGYQFKQNYNRNIKLFDTNWYIQYNSDADHPE